MPDDIRITPVGDEVERIGEFLVDQKRLRPDLAMHNSGNPGKTSPCEPWSADHVALKIGHLSEPHLGDSQSQLSLMRVVR